MSLYVTEDENNPGRYLPQEPWLQAYADGYTAWVSGERDCDAANLYKPRTMHWHHFNEG